MKIITIFLSLISLASATTKPWNLPVALQVRGGAEIGPLDGDLAMQLAKTAATAYVAGSASKYIAGQSGGSSSQLADFVTTDLWATSALCTAISAAMFHLGDTGFNSLKMLAASNVVALLLRMDKEGFSADTVMSNKVQTAVTLALAVLAFV